MVGLVSNATTNWVAGYLKMILFRRAIFRSVVVRCVVVPRAERCVVVPRVRRVVQLAGVWRVRNKSSVSVYAVQTLRCAGILRASNNSFFESAFDMSLFVFALAMPGFIMLAYFFVIIRAVSNMQWSLHNININLQQNALFVRSLSYIVCLYPSIFSRHSFISACRHISLGSKELRVANTFFCQCYSCRR